MPQLRCAAALLLLASLTGCGGASPPAREPAQVAAPVVRPTSPPPAPVRAPAAAPQLAATPRVEVRLDREWVERLREGDGRVWGSARIVPALDATGRPDGLTLLDVRPDGIYGSAGLRDGDTVRAVNGLPLTSEAKALEAYAALRSAPRVELLVVRRGAPLVIVVVLGD